MANGNATLQLAPLLGSDGGWHCVVCKDGGRHYSAMMVGGAAKKKFLFTRQLQKSSIASFAREKKREKRKQERERERVFKPALGYVTTLLVSLFPAPSILALLVGKDVTTQAPSNSRNTTSSKKKIQELKAKRSMSLSTLSNRE
jgi:hypothetical protein